MIKSIGAVYWLLFYVLAVMVVGSMVSFNVMEEVFGCCSVAG